MPPKLLLWATRWYVTLSAMTPMAKMSPTLEALRDLVPTRGESPALSHLSGYTLQSLRRSDSLACAQTGYYRHAIHHVVPTPAYPNGLYLNPLIITRHLDHIAIYLQDHTIVST